MKITNHKNEIKNFLDSNELYREMLFRRGYIFSNKRIDHLDRYPFYDIWEETKIEDFYLYVQEKQTFYVQEKEGIAVAIIGHAYNPFDMTYHEDKLCFDLIDAFEKGEREYFDKISELTGLHVIILVNGQKFYVCQDACSLTGCYFGKFKNTICIAEHPQLLADLFNLKMDTNVKRLVSSKCYNIGNRHLPGNISPYKSVRRLGANTYLYYDREFSIHRFYPIKKHLEITDEEEINSTVKKIGELIHNGIELCTYKWNRCAISLSGGTDSKTTLACANGLYDKFSYFSFHSKPQELVDANGAKKICDCLGLKHTLYTIPEDNNYFEKFDIIKKILMHNTSYFVNLNDNEIRKYIYLHDLNVYDIELKSWASEVARVFLERKYQIQMPKVLTERHCSIFQTRYFAHPRLLKWSDDIYYKFLREIGLEKPLYNYEHADLFYWEIRMGCWGVSVISSQQLYHRVTMPMNNRKILDLFLCLPRENRIDDSIHKQIMAVMNQAVADVDVEIPNLYFHSYRIWMEKIYYKYKTLLYRKS